MVVLVVLMSAFMGATQAADERIQVAAVALFKDKAMLIINGKQRLLKIGKESPEGVVLLESSSETAIITTGGERLTLHLDGKIVGTYVRGLAAKTLRLYPDRSGHYVVDGLINGNGTHFLIDTGATSVSINRDMAKRMGLLYRVDGVPTNVSTASGIARAYRVVFDEIRIQNLVLKQVEGMVVDGSFPEIALLGQSFLNRLDMRREGNLLELQER
jgi:aspartyl protease family protein